MTIAYLINQYPKVSHSFIRREIAALEAQGIPIARFSIRPCRGELVDGEDQAEVAKTHAVLDAGIPALLFSFVLVAIAQPLQMVRAIKLALRVGRRSQRGVLRHLFYLIEACYLQREFSARGIRHVHAHFGTNSTTVAMLCRTLKGPTYSFTAHGPEEFDMPLTLSLTDKIEHAAFVVAISSFGKSQLYRWCDRRHWSKIHIVRCGVDAKYLETPLTSVPDTPNLVCIGRLCEQKGHLLLLEAAAKLATQGIGFQLWLVGDGPLRADIEALIQEHCLGQHVSITGWASGSQIQDYLLKSRAMVLPSFAEGLPVVIMESLALGRPVISTYVAGIPELVEPGKCGWLVPPGSVDELAIAIQQALTTPQHQLQEMGKQGRQRALQNHNISIEVKTLAALFASQIQANVTASITPVRALKTIQSHGSVEVKKV